MARVTNEDCIEIVTNRFELVALASVEAHNIGTGAQIQVKKNNDKNAVISLREIAEGKVNPYDLREAYIEAHQKNIINSEPELDDFVYDIEEDLNSQISESDLGELSEDHSLDNQDDEFNPDLDSDLNFSDEE